ncbi:uncharacterized protein LOC126687971 [Mercurialis annua]|uniref:uncharacterized protein LOC126687971 n=1 Tax=Mercurialis annua TaxID=3986 RepID=UPI0021600FCE|nr:uncharacterized protein LOC126687971 [Mercurialis annua]
MSHALVWSALEDAFHALIRCPLIQPIWSLSVVGNCSSGSSSFVEWWDRLAQGHSTNVLASLAMLLWGIWMNRNNLVWNQTLWGICFVNGVWLKFLLLQMTVVSACSIPQARLLLISINLNNGRFMGLLEPRGRSYGLYGGFSADQISCSSKHHFRV